MNKPTSDLCPECGNPVPLDSPHQLCPSCLMGQAFASQTLAGEKTFTPDPPDPKEIADKFPQFKILECLGHGGMGVVYKALQKSLNRLVAIKILTPERTNDLKFAERFAREAEFLAQLSHPHIVTIHDFGETDGMFYLVMEFVDGVNLRDLLREGKLEAKQALAIVSPICEALQYAHDKGIAHRDIKPENLLLDREGRIKIADFGIASLIGAANEKSGTPAYMAPEQMRGNVSTDHRADIYALGVVFYEMLTGERPGKDLVAPLRKVQIDVRIDEIVLKALEKDPQRRYQTAKEFRKEVETMADSSPNGIPPQTNVDENEPSKFSRLAIMGACCFIFLYPLVDTWRQWANMLPRGYTVWENLPSMLKVREVFYGNLIAVFGTTILGWMAVSEIRRSGGKIRSMKLAVFEGAFYPLLAIDGLIAVLIHFSSIFFRLWSPYRANGATTKLILSTLLFSVIADVLIIRSVWKKVNSPSSQVFLVSTSQPRWDSLAMTICGLLVFLLFWVFRM